MPTGREHKATNLPAGDLNGSSDPYCVVELTGYHSLSAKVKREWDPSLRQRAQTHRINRTLKPEWNVEGVRFKLPRHGGCLKFAVFDYDAISEDDLLRRLNIALDDLPSGHFEGWFPLYHPEEDGCPVEPSSYAGPAIKLKIELRRSDFGDFISHLWPPPPVVNPTPPFDPNVFMREAMVFKTAVRSGIAFFSPSARSCSSPFQFLLIFCSKLCFAELRVYFM